MAVERRFLIVSSIARLIQRESHASTRIVEGHFPPRPERLQLVRVEREHAVLVLGQRQPDGRVAEEQAEIPGAHAEALIDVAAGTVAFDRVDIELPSGTQGQLDRFLLPRGIDVLTSTMEEGADDDLPDWLGLEVTGRPEYEYGSLTISGLPAPEEIRISNRGLEELLDLLGSRSPSRLSRARLTLPERHQFGMHSADARLDQGLSGSVTGGETATPPEASTDEPRTEKAPSIAEPDNIEHDAPMHGSTPEATQLQPQHARAPRLRADELDVDEGLARLARSLAPRGASQVH